VPPVQEDAVRIFEEFRKVFHKSKADSDWSLDFYEDDQLPDLGEARTEMALELLRRVGLVAQVTLAGACSLTELGARLCRSGDDIERYLG
jgi:hypothetical protein